MRIAYGLAPLGLVLMAACTPTTEATPTTDPQFLEVVPEPVLAAAAPWQNLNAVTLREDDGCYWYRHVGARGDDIPASAHAGRAPDLHARARGRRRPLISFAR